MGFIRYESRFQAGQILAELLDKQNSKLKSKITNQNTFCYTIPNGGVPVAEGFCDALDLQYDLLIVRKVKIPYNTEAGFGSVTTDGTVLLNESLMQHLDLTEQQIQESIQLTKGEIQERLKLYNKSIDLTEIYTECIKGKFIFMMDDGLASGFTMLAAIKMIKKYHPEKIFIAVPTAPLSTIKRFKGEVDEIFCPNIRDVWQFAVADAYRRWYDVPESEV